MSQAIENLNIQYGYSEGKVGDPAWWNVMQRWTDHPDFPTYWAQNKDQFDPATNTVVQMLLTT